MIEYERPRLLDVERDKPSFFGKGSPALTSDRTDWETPRDLFERLNNFWRFDLDAAASDANHLCPDYFTKETNGLAQSWKGRRVWLNPPYGKDIAAWVRKAYEETRDGQTLVIMLVPARTDTRWFHDYIREHAAEVKFIRGRLKYTLGGGRTEFGAVPVDAR